MGPLKEPLIPIPSYNQTKGEIGWPLIFWGEFTPAGGGKLHAFGEKMVSNSTYQSQKTPRLMALFENLGKFVNRNSIMWFRWFLLNSTKYSYHQATRSRKLTIFFYSRFRFEFGCNSPFPVRKFACNPLPSQKIFS